MMHQRFSGQGVIGRGCAVGLLAAAAATASAQPDLYVIEYKYEDARMSAVRVDGVNQRRLFTFEPTDWLPIGVTYNPTTQKFFWQDPSNNIRIYSSDANGSNQSTVTTLGGFGRGASLDAQGRIFFSAGSTLYRVDGNGANLTALHTGVVANTLGAPEVDITNGQVYFGTDGKLYRMSVNGGPAKEIFRGGSNINAVSLDVAGGYIYMSDSDTITDFIGRVKLDGSDFTILIDNSPLNTTSPGLIDMMVAPELGYIFVAEDFRNDVRRYPLSGAGFSTIFTSLDDGSPSGMVLSTGQTTQPMLDCNGNGIADSIDIANGAADCDNNGYLDFCQYRPCRPLNILFDTGSDAADSQGRAVGVPSSWQVFQSFDVPAGGWRVGQLATDGYMSEFYDQSGLRMRLYPDDGSSTRPNESVTLAQSTFSLWFDHRDVNWAYAPVDVELPEGRYWVRIEAVKPTKVGASVNMGFEGTPSLSRGASGNWIQSSRSAALRVIAYSCPSDFDGTGFVDTDDFDAFVVAFESGAQSADFDGTGFVDTDDFDAFVVAFESGC
jgi:sugar lactone lactonase YvrE